MENHEVGRAKEEGAAETAAAAATAARGRAEPR